MSLIQEPQSRIPIRMAHLDLKGMPPTPHRLVAWLKLVANCGYNAVLLEWEDQFPWSIDRRFRSSTSYSHDTVQDLIHEAQRLNLELVPLVQCLGHLEFVLRHDAYTGYREDPTGLDIFDPLSPAGRELLQTMIAEVLDLMPGIRRFHLGGDEAWTFGSQPETRAYINQHGKAQLYLQHVNPLLDRLLDHGLRPMLWHDMMIDWDLAALRDLGRRADLVVWGYQGDPAQTSAHYHVRHIQRFADADIPLWGATAYKGADAMDGDLPDPGRRASNALAWVRQCETFGMQGVIATGWSRYSFGRMQCDPNDAALDCLALVGAILHDGAAPPGGIEACRTWLAHRDPASAAARDAVVHLTACLRTGWGLVRLYDGQAWLSAHHSERDPALPLRYLREQHSLWLAQVNDAAQQVLRVLSQWTDPRWVTEYIDSRVAPLAQALRHRMVNK